MSCTTYFLNNRSTEVLILHATVDRSQNYYVTDMHKATKCVCFIIAFSTRVQATELISYDDTVTSVISLNFSQILSETSHEKELDKPEFIEITQRKCAKTFYRYVLCTRCHQTTRKFEWDMGIALGLNWNFYQWAVTRMSQNNNISSPILFTS